MLSEADRLTIEGLKSSIPLLPMSANDKYLAKCLEFSCQGLKDDDQLNPLTTYIHEQDQRYPHSIKTKTLSSSSTTHSIKTSCPIHLCSLSLDYHELNHLACPVQSQSRHEP